MSTLNVVYATTYYTDEVCEYKIFTSKETLSEYCKKKSPIKVYCSEHSTEKKAKIFLKKLKGKK